jgi:hypothetical protein
MAWFYICICFKEAFGVPIALLGLSDVFFYRSPLIETRKSIVSARKVFRPRNEV